MKVTVVFDKKFGATASPKVGDAYWLVESPENCALAERLRNEPKQDPNSAVFKEGNSAPGKEAMCLLSLVDEHHPNWTEIEFIGVALDPDVRHAFAGEKGTLTSTATGFVLSLKA